MSAGRGAGLSPAAAAVGETQVVCSNGSRTRPDKKIGFPAFSWTVLFRPNVDFFLSSGEPWRAVAVTVAVAEAVGRGVAVAEAVGRGRGRGRGRRRAMAVATV